MKREINWSGLQSAWTAFQQRALPQARAAVYAPAPTQPAPESSDAPLQYNPGMFPSFSAWIFRSVYITAQSIEDPLQTLNQSSQVNMYAHAGRWIPVAQNIAPLTLEGANKAATLVPAYGTYLDTIQDVYANIGRGG